LWFKTYKCINTGCQLLRSERQYEVISILVSESETLTEQHNGKIGVWNQIILKKERGD